MPKTDTPIFAASVAVVQGGEVLLIRRQHVPYAGRWTLPGGRLEAGESPESCAVREIGEELGLRVADLKPVLVMTVSAAFPSRLAVFATDRFAGAPSPSDEIGAWAWMPPEAIAALPTTPRLATVLRRAMALFGGP